MFNYLDECKVLDRLPTYVSVSPDPMPIIRLYERDTNVFMTMLKNFDGKFGQIEEVLVAICRARHLCRHVQ